MTAGEYLEKFRTDDYVVSTIRSDNATRHPYFQKREATFAFKNFWKGPGASRLKLHFEREYGVNVSYNKQMSAVLLALKLLFFEIREEVSGGA